MPVSRAHSICHVFAHNVREYVYLLSFFLCSTTGDQALGQIHGNYSYDVEIGVFLKAPIFPGWLIPFSILAPCNLLNVSYCKRLHSALKSLKGI